MTTFTPSLFFNACSLGCRRTALRRFAPSLLAPFGLVFLCVSLANGQPSPSPQPGDVVFEMNFETTDQQAVWSDADFAKWEPGLRDSTSLCITVPKESSTGSGMITMPFDLTPYRGYQLVFDCMAKADEVTQPDQPHLGVKFMLHYQSESNGPQWQNEQNVHGTFGWRHLGFLSTIAPDAEGGVIQLGLQGSSGRVCFDEIQIRVFRKPLPRRPTPSLNRGPVFKGHHLPRLRGVMSPNTFRDQDLRTLAEDWNANVIRWQITRNWNQAGTDRELDEYDRWIDAELADLDQVLEAAQRYRIKVVVDMHSPPGGRYENRDLAIFHEPIYQDHYVKLWEKIASRYKGRSAVWGYDLVNEPVQNDPSPPGVPDYLGTQVRAAKAIRTIDSDVPIFIEACEWDSARGYPFLEPVDVPRVIYQVHLYDPHSFTHQGVQNEVTGIAYPGMIEGKQWNQQALRAVLKPVREFQLAYNVHIYVGEFSAIRWAPGAAQYLSDCIDLFEEYDWDWTYHAYREWDGWSVEHNDDPNDHESKTQPTDRQKLLLKWFSKNQKP
ncbi:glycoside hydrolase family 5 protein [Novipirellula artificiosorum]|uniref:Endoglucanase C n=1 Tax=Novipirellula artificiosorum TaxID=2528016 RepID=A0A5C6DEI2_9BACT|nr:cellulase family glycosylhydrolase [Novipirellula artificiosorum]TWU34334.1 Endoglucanase C [Novipirellula artificiosorum]